MTEKLSIQAYQAIKNDIVFCRLTPGKQVTQSQLIEQYMYGIVPIREALQRLAQENLVQAIPRSGYLITNITVSDIHEIYDLRLPFEITAAKLAVERGRDEHLQALLLKASFTYQFEKSQGYEIFLKKNHAFHVSIAEASGNQRLVSLISRMMDDLTRVLFLGLGVKDRGEEMQAEHLELAQALSERNKEAAVEAVRLQIEHSKQTTLDSLANPHSNYYADTKYDQLKL